MSAVPRFWDPVLQDYPMWSTIFRPLILWCKRNLTLKLITMHKHNVALFISTLFVLGASAQVVNDEGLHHCHVHQAEAELLEQYANHPEVAEQVAAANQALDERAQIFAQSPNMHGSNYVIPVVVHIIHDNGAENISDAQVYDAVEVINDDFNRLNSDWDDVNSAFVGLVADIGIEFRLAQKDPNGNCTNGITRTVSDLTYEGNQSMKNLIQWPRDSYMNVWISASAGGAAGYTLTPGSVDGWWGQGADGIVIQHTYFGRIGTGSIGRSRTWTHETGHWLNLRHTWGGTNDPGLSSNCNSDDNVSDTPNTIGWTSCNSNGQTCGSLDNVENYMEYSYCSKMFTEGQKSRMLAALTSNTAERNELWQNSNLIATGTYGPDILCAADMTASNRVICVGDSVVFQDASYNGVDGWEWQFPGGNPSTANTSSPIVYYDTPGTYNVSLTAFNSGDQASTTNNNYITVLPADGYPTPYVEGFESLNSVPSDDWFIFDGQSDGSFNITSATSYSGSKSIKLINNSNDEGNLDELISNTIDLSNMSDATVTFKYAYRQRNSSNDDLLRFYVSNDCGNSWSLREQMRGLTDLPTTSPSNSSFTPSSQSQWAEVVIDNIQTSMLVSNFRFKFWFESDGGNNLYIDDINIFGNIVGVEELSAESLGLNIFPNPVNSTSLLAFELQERAQVQMDIMDVMGRKVMELANGSLSRGQHQYTISKADLGAGMYFVRMSVGDRTTMVKFLVD